MRRPTARLTAAGSATTALVIALAACSSGSKLPTPTLAMTHTLDGQLVVADLTVGIPACGPSRTFEDALSYLQGGTQLPCAASSLPAPDEGARSGANVTVTSMTGRVLGTGHLQNGVASMHGVRLPFTVTGLPSEDAYVVNVSTVTSATYPAAASQSNGWVVELSVGHHALT